MTTAQQDAERAGELAALREAVSDLIEGSGGIAAARRRLDASAAEVGPGYDAQAWRLLGTEMGLAGLGIAEDLGGAGGGLAELTVVAEELGRSLLPVPFFSSTVLAGQVLARCPGTGTDALARLSAGELAAFAGTDCDGCWRPGRLPVEAQADGQGWRLRGRADFVLDGAAAAHLVVAARTPAGCDLFLVAGDGQGVQRREMATLDPTRAQASVGFDGAAGTPLTTGGAGAAAVTAGLDVALLVLAAEQDPSRLAEAAAVAKIWCSDAYTTVATENVQIHGGIGFTWEHDAHLYFRRARADEQLLGGAAVHRERLATLLSW